MTLEYARGLEVLDGVTILTMGITLFAVMIVLARLEKACHLRGLVFMEPYMVRLVTMHVYKLKSWRF